MKKNILKEKKVISALMVGISAMMAISSPITAYAEGEEAPEAENTEPTTEETSTVEAEPVTTAPAQEQAEVAEKAIEEIVNEVAPITSEETGADTEDGGKVAESAVEDVVETAQKVEELATAAAGEVEKAEEDLKEAEKADVNTVEEAKDVVEIIQAAEEAAEVAAATVEETKTEAAVINEEIQQATADEDQEKAEEAFERLEILVEQAQETVEARKTQLDKLTTDYSKAKEELEKAEKDFLDALADASSDVQAAKQKLVEVKAEVNDLKDAVETAQDKLEAEAEAAQDLKEELENNRNGSVSWDKQTELIKAYITDYYIPQVLGTADEESIICKKVKGIDRQDYTYYEFTYLDAEGNEVTKYFNLDRTDKKAVAGNPYAGLGGSKDIVIFEKSEIEVGAEKYLRELYANESWFKDAVINGKGGAPYNTVQEKMKSGDFRVYSYEKDGKVYYISQEQLDGTLEDDRNFYIDEEGNLIVDDCKATEVIQNINNNTHGQPDLVVNTKDIKTGDEETDNEVTQFIEYTEAVNKAEAATEQAKVEVEKLEEAIDGLKNEKNYILTAAEVLGVTDVAAFLGIEVPESVDLDSLTIAQAIKYLDNLLDKANEKMADAIEDLNSITAQKDAARQAIDELAKENDVNPEAVINVIESQIEGNTENGENQKAEDEKAEEEQKEDEKEANTEDEKAEESTEENTEDKEEEIKDEDTQEETETENKEETSKKKERKEETREEAREENREEAGGNSEFFSEAYSGTYEPVQEWNFVFTSIPEAVDAENKEAEEENNRINLGTGRNYDNWTESSVIDLVNGIAEEKEAETVLPKAVKVPEKKTESKKVVTIEDEDTALAATAPVAEKEAHMNWWWLLIVILLGAAGEEMYRKHREKELEQNIEK